MKIKHLPSEHFLISGMPTLDSIDVFIENFEPGKGRMTLQCYGDAWTTYFGSMGEVTIQEFFATSSVCYLAGKLLGNNHKRTKTHEKYLTRIVQAVKDALKDIAAAAPSTGEVDVEPLPAQLSPTEFLEQWADKHMGKGNRPCGWPNFGSISYAEVAKMLKEYAQPAASEKETEPK